MHKFLKISGIILLTIILILVGISIYLQTENGQIFTTKNVNTYLKSKIKTPFEIRNIKYSLPNWVELNGVYFADLQGDTLLAGKKIHVNLDMLGLLQNKLTLNEIDLENVSVNIKRNLPDTVFNFAFLIKSFAKKAVKVTEIDTVQTVPLIFRISDVAFKNVTLKYHDEISGTEIKTFLKSFKTSFLAFEPSISKFHLDKIIIEGSTIDLRMYPWLHQKKASKADTLDLAFKELIIKNTNWKYLDENSGILNRMKLGNLVAKGNKINVSGQNIHLKSLKLDESDVELTMLKSIKKVENIPKNESESTGWKVLADNLNVNESNIEYHEQNAIANKAGIDFNHLILSQVNIVSDDFLYSNKEILGRINKANFKDKSGFEIVKLNTDFVYDNLKFSFKKLYLQTPKTIIRDEIILKYASLSQLTSDLGKVAINASLKNSQIAFSDIVIFFPEYRDSAPFRGNLNQIVKVNGLIAGKLNDLKFTKTSLSGFDKGLLNFDGNIYGLINGPQMGLNLNIKKLEITKTDLIKIIPRETVPNSLELPNRLNITGKISGTLNDLFLDTNISSEYGIANYEGKLVDFTSKNSQQYDGNITLTGFEMGKFLKLEDIGKLTITAKIKGKGFDTKTLQTEFEGIVQQAEYKGYNYKNGNLKGGIMNQIFAIIGNINDPNIDLKIDSKMDISKEYPTIIGYVSINKINLKELGLYAKNIDIKGDIEMNIVDSNPENPTGTITINNGIFTQNGKASKIENIVLIAKNPTKGKNININTPFLKANFLGEFNYLQIPDIFTSTINNYFKLPNIEAKPITEPYTLAMDLKFAFHPIIQSFFPLLTRLDTTRLVAKIDSKTNEFTANLVMPILEYDTIKVSNVKVDLVGIAENLKYNGQLDAISFTGFQVRKTEIFGLASNNTASFNTTFKDAKNKARNNVNGMLQLVDNQYRIKLLDNGLTLNYLPWKVDSSGYFQYGNSGLIVNNFNLNRKQQKLSINTNNTIPNGPIIIKMDSLEIQNFVTLFSTDSTLASGKIDGEILLSNYITTPNYKGDFSIKNFIVKQTEIGDLKANIFNETTNKITVSASLMNQNNDVLLTGNYLLNTKNNIDINLLINKLSAETVAAFSFGELNRAKGNLIGQLEIKGAASKPQIDGNLAFEKVAFDVKSFGGRYLIDNQKLLFEGQKISLNQFIITDTLSQKLVLNGTVLHQNLPDFNYDLTVDAKNFLILDSHRNDNDLIYGKGIVDADLTVKGISQKAKIDGDIKIREKSAISIIIPNSESELGDNEGVVLFVNKNNPELEMAKDTLVEKPFVNDFISEISLNIEVDEKSELTLVVDEINGDNLKVKGNGKLNAGINSNGKPYMLGSYDLSEGSYGITFEVLKKQFIIQKGSSIVWSGDPMNGDVDINAIYKVNTAPLDLMENEIAINRDVYRQKMNFEVQLNMSGKLSKPNITFKIVPSETQRLVANEVITNVKARLVALQADEVNKQVFALLVLNRFFSEKSSDFFSTNAGGTNATAFARQSVSKLLTDQLSKMTAGNIKGFALDVNLSSSEDFFDGISSTRTDLNLGLSKAFFKDKVEIKVGRNFELENNTNISRNPSEVFDNLMLNYKLSSDGKFLFKAFRKNQFQSVLEGFIVETGVGFSIAKDYGKLGDLFRKKENMKIVKE